MSFLKKLLGHKNEDDKKAVDTEYRTEPRVLVDPSHGILFHATIGFEKTNLMVTTISRRGLSVKLSHAQAKQAKLQKQITGNLTMKNHAEVPLTLLIKWVSDSGAGGVCEENNPQFFNLTATMFQIELEALKLARISPDLVKQTPDGQSWWFRNSMGYELFFVEKQQKIKSFSLHLRKYVLESVDGNRVRQIQISEETQPKLKEKDFVFSKNIPREVMNEGHRFVFNIMDLPPTLKQQILKALES